MEPGNLSKYKLRLLQMRERLIPTINRIEENLHEAVRAPGDISNAPTHLANYPSTGIDNELGMAENEQGILEQVESALERVEKGEFGRCQQCSRPIADERLDVLPYTPYCIQCATEVEGVTEG